MRQALELALQFIESNADSDSERELVATIKEALAQPETPYKIGQRIAKTGGGIAHLWSAVSQDDEIAEAERGFKEALAQPEKLDQDEVDIRSRLYQRIHELETQLARGEQEPVAWATKDDFYRELERELKRIREEIKIKSVTMRCKDYDIALPIIGTDFGRVLVGQVSTPFQRTWVGLTNDEVNNFAAGCHLGKSVQGAIYEAEAKLKEKNT